MGEVKDRAGGRRERYDTTLICEFIFIFIVLVIIVFVLGIQITLFIILQTASVHCTIGQQHHVPQSFTLPPPHTHTLKQQLLSFSVSCHSSYSHLQSHLDKKSHSFYVTLLYIK